MSELRPILPKTTTIIPLSNNDICVTSLIKEKIREYMMKGQAKEVDPGDEASPIKKTNEYSTLIRKHSLPATSTRPLETPSTRPLETPSSSAKPCPPPLVPRRPVAILRPVDTSTEEEEEMFVGSTTGDEEVEEEIVEVGEEEEESDEFDDAIDSSNSKMHILEEEEDDGSGAKLSGGERSSPILTSLMKNGVSNGDLPETPPSDMDDHEDEEMAENGVPDKILVVANGKSSLPLVTEKSELNQTPKDTPDGCDKEEKAEDKEDVEMEEEKEEEEKRNGEVSGKETSDKEENGTISEEKENDTAKSPSIDSSLAEDKETKSANSKTNQDDKPHSEDTDSTHTETDKPHKEADKPHKEVDKPGRRKSAEKSPKKGTTENSPAESKENEKDTEKEERVKEKVTPKGAQSDEIEKAEKVNPKEATSKTENSDGKEGGKADVEGLAEDGKTEYANEDKSPDAPEATDKDSEQDPLESDSEDILDEKEGVLTVNGRPKVFPVEEPPKAEDKSPEYKKSQDLSEIMLANNTEITICKTPLVSAASDGKLRRLSSGSSGSAKFCAKGSPFAAEDSVNPGRPTASAESDSLAGRKASEAPLAGRGSGAAPGDADDALDGEKVSEAELMLAKCTDGEITITKSSGEVAAPRLRSRELKRSLSSEGGGGEDGGVGESRGEMERESKRAHLSEEDLVTEQFDVDLVDPIEGEEDERERLVRDFVDSASKSAVEMTANYAKLKKEIHVLSELAQAKELEWNSILRLKKLKEEMWERLARKMKIENVLNNTKRRPSASSSPSPTPSKKPHYPANMSSPIIMSMNVPAPTPPSKNQRLILPKPTSQLAQSPAPSPNTEIILAEGRQGRIKDVQTIIADYRSKNPNETHSAQVPKIRGRRSSTNSSRGSNHSSGSSSSSAPNDALSAARYANPSLLSMANLALGSGGGQVRNGGGGGGGSQQQQLDVQLNYLNNVQVQRHSQAKPQSMPLPPVAQAAFPEVTLHPVLPSPTQQHNSLLHGILTKTNSGKQAQPQPSPSSHHPASPLPPHLQNPRSTSFSPTLARLLTAPERNRGGQTMPQATPSFSASNNLSAMLRAQKMRNQPCSNDIVASLKQKIVPQQSRQQLQQQQQSEITITPVTNLQINKPNSKEDSIVNLDDEDENDRLVIDETRTGDLPTGNPNGGSEQIPECQGCHRMSAQFVCAGCGNQWYCSRECQVAAWEEHSDVCSG